MPVLLYRAQGTIAAFEIDLSQVVVDSIDCLANSFQFFGKNERITTDKLKLLYGEGVLQYLPTSTYTGNWLNKSLGNCILATTDRSVISEHYKNQIIIYGKARTRFKSSFKMRARDIDVNSIEYLEAVAPYPRDINECSEACYSFYGSEFFNL